MKDERIRMALLGEFYAQLLELDAWVSERPKATQVQVLVCEKLEERKALIEEAIAQAAMQRGITPEELKLKIWAGEKP